MDWDESQHFPKELLPKLGELGLMGIQFPEAMGGAGMSAVDYCICIEELARVDPSVSLSVAAHNGLGAAHISMFGSDAQKQQYLVPLATGKKLAAWGLTEPARAAMRRPCARPPSRTVTAGC
jgi:alkylation response protein AidB-like acyl-CoA dehydrogenase